MAKLLRLLPVLLLIIMLFCGCGSNKPIEQPERIELRSGIYLSQRSVFNSYKTREYYPNLNVYENATAHFHYGLAALSAYYGTTCIEDDAFVIECYGGVGFHWFRIVDETTLEYLGTDAPLQALTETAEAGDIFKWSGEIGEQVQIVFSHDVD